MKVAFVIGHHEKAKGKFSKYLKSTEWDFYKEVMSYFKNPIVFYHNHNISSYIDRQSETGRKLNLLPLDLVLELHFNGFNTKSTGVETFYHHKSSKGKYYAEKFNDICVRWTALKLRGAKPLNNSKQNGFGFLNSNKHPSILIEPFFGDNESDRKAIKNAYNMHCILRDFIENIS